MLNILSRITGSNRSVVKDARRVYQKLMAQTRLPQIYGETLCADTTDGRMEILCLHQSTTMYVLRGHGDNGAKLSQALYDVMIDNFDIALREEGLSDTGVARRIKPMAAMFFERAKLYTDAFDNIKKQSIGEKQSIGIQALEDICAKYIVKNVSTQEIADYDGASHKAFSQYAAGFLLQLQTKKLGEIAKAEFEFPKFPK